ncbi:hypothetical protein AXG93_473s1190 [Marchantia polymorpha subsp. ruderalis]|uniref:Uncharacterized protein n=1 Tax=Marchantia polymorpha subsp. ruderalis TaxID=1480154 RepID=A0A176W2F9_MARPO|nr:hypothetical protein AXG93_473s1190 [Marchantia polymorpha subsp. ruderalis]
MAEVVVCGDRAEDVVDFAVAEGEEGSRTAPILTDDEREDGHASIVARRGRSCATPKSPGGASFSSFQRQEAAVDYVLESVGAGTVVEGCCQFYQKFSLEGAESKRADYQKSGGGRVLMF